MMSFSDAHEDAKYWWERLYPERPFTIGARYDFLEEKYGITDKAKASFLFLYLQEILKYEVQSLESESNDDSSKQWAHFSTLQTLPKCHGVSPSPIEKKELKAERFKAEAELVEKWNRAFANGVSKSQFASDNGMTHEFFEAIHARVRMRKNRAKDNANKRPNKN